MTVKEKIISAVQSLDENTSIDLAIDRLYLLQKIKLGIQQADAGDVVEHDEFMKQVENAQVGLGPLDSSGPRGFA